MRAILKVQIIGKHLPLVLAHRGGSAHAMENSSSAIKESLKYHPDILEVDVRKSRDQVLFCHHGNLHISLLFFVIGRFIGYRSVKRMIRGVETFEEILTTIQKSDSNVVVLLDLKSQSIDPHDLRKNLREFQIPNIWIAAYTLGRLERLRRNLGEKYVYVLNRPMFFFDLMLRRAAKVADVVHLFPYQWNVKNIDMARRLGLQVAFMLLFPERRKKLRLAVRGKPLWFGYEDLSSVLYVPPKGGQKLKGVPTGSQS